MAYWLNADFPILILKYEDLLNNIELEIQKIIDYFYKNFNIKVENQRKKINNIITSTKFDNLKKKEIKFGFSENSHFSFFRIGQQRQWVNVLNNKQIDILEQKFRKQLIELNYYIND